jgi:hypothetical protein
VSSTDQLLSAGGGILGVLIVVILVVDAVLWLFLPFILISKLNRVIQRLEALEAIGEGLERNSRKPGDKRNESSVKYIPGINS